MLTLADLVEGTTGQRLAEEMVPNLELSEVVIDSREVRPNSLFVALRGERQDGHDFVADAFARGAVAAIIEREIDAECQIVDTKGLLPETSIRPPICLMAENSLKAFQRLAAFWRARFSPRVIGVTGSVGKTTTKEMIWSVLRKRFHTLKSWGSYNNEIGLPLTLLYLDSSHERVVLEMGMYALGEIAELAAIASPSSRLAALALALGVALGAPSRADAQAAPETDEEKAFYSIGTSMASQLDRVKPISDRELDLLIQGVRDAVGGRALVVEQQEGATLVRIGTAIFGARL